MHDWSWSPPHTYGDANKRALYMYGMPLAAAGFVALGITTSDRVWAIIGVVVLGIYVTGLIESNRSRRCSLSIDEGVLTLDDGRQSRTVELDQIREVKVRQRSARSGVRWSVEVVTEGAAVVSAIPSLQGWIALPKDLASDLERQLIEQVDRNRRTTTIMDGKPPEPEPSLAAGTLQDRFEWTPRVHPNAERNRKRVKVGFGLAALAIAVFAGISERDAGTVGLLLSITVVPLMVLGFGAVVLWLYRVGQNFRIVVDGQTMTVERGGRHKTIVADLAGAESVTVDSSVQTTHTSNTTTRSVVWTLSVQPAVGDLVKVGFPQAFGLASTREDYALLEAELRRRC